MRFLLATLAVQQGSPSDHEVVVVDDASSDGTAEWLRGHRLPCALSIVAAAEQQGRAAARNAGLRAVSGDVVCFLDGDVLAPPTLVAAHRARHAAARDRPVCVTGHPWFWQEVATWRFKPPEGPLLDAGLLGEWHRVEAWAGRPLAPPSSGVRYGSSDPAAFLWCVTRDVSVRRDIALQEGGFDEGFRGYGLEDWEFGYRLAARGVRFLGDPAAAVWHQRHPPTDRDARDLPRNFGRFLARHPDADIGLMPFCPPWSDPGAYGRLRRALRRLEGHAPATAEALRDVAVFAGGQWVRRAGRPGPTPGWGRWTARWGPDAVRRIQAEAILAAADPRARPALALFQSLAGWPGG